MAQKPIAGYVLLPSCVIIFVLIGCYNVVVKTQWPELKQEEPKNIVVRINNIKDVRSYGHRAIGRHWPLFFVKDELYSYSSEENVSEIVRKKIVTILKAQGFTVLEENSSNNKIDIEITGKISNYSVTTNGLLAGYSGKALASLEIKAYDYNRNSIYFEKALNEEFKVDTPNEPEIINKALDLLLLKALSPLEYYKRPQQNSIADETPAGE